MEADNRLYEVVRLAQGCDGEKAGPEKAPPASHQESIHEQLYQQDHGEDEHDDAGVAVMEESKNHPHLALQFVELIKSEKKLLDTVSKIVPSRGEVQASTHPH